MNPKSRVGITEMLINNKERVLEVKNLRTYFYTDEGVVKAVDGLSYYVNRGECVGLVGESACGKSVSAMSVLRLIPYPPGVIVGGEIIFKGEDLLQASEERMRHIRGNLHSHGLSGAHDILGCYGAGPTAGDHRQFEGESRCHGLTGA